MMPLGIRAMLLLEAVVMMVTTGVAEAGEDLL